MILNWFLPMRQFTLWSDLRNPWSLCCANIHELERKRQRTEFLLTFYDEIRNILLYINKSHCLWHRRVNDRWRADYLLSSPSPLRASKKMMWAIRFWYSGTRWKSVTDSTAVIGDNGREYLSLVRIKRNGKTAVLGWSESQKTCRIPMSCGTVDIMESLGVDVDWVCRNDWKKYMQMLNRYF
jgi:hypothetical protein